MRDSINLFLDHARQMRDFILNTIFPIECLSCQKEGDWLCGGCYSKIKISLKALCPNCQQLNLYGEYCHNCRSNFSINGVWIACDYKDKLISGLIKQFKYRFTSDLVKILSSFTAKYLEILLNNISQNDRRFPFSGNIIKANKPRIFNVFKQSLLIPVPLHNKRKRWRGFNQAQELGRLIADYHGLAFVDDNLIKIKHTKPQAKLGKKSRISNIKNSFAFNGPELANRNIILVDDVLTTGATLNECAKVLKAHGADEVWGLVIAQG